VAMAGRLRRETTLTIREIAQRLHMGSWKSLNNRLYLVRCLPGNRQGKIIYFIHILHQVKGI
jgi:hypothetical protein